MYALSNLEKASKRSLQAPLGRRSHEIPYRISLDQHGSGGGIRPDDRRPSKDLKEERHPGRHDARLRHAHPRGGLGKERGAGPHPGYSNLAEKTRSGEPELSPSPDGRDQRPRPP